MNNELFDFADSFEYRNNFSKYEDTFLNQATENRRVFLKFEKISDYYNYLLNNPDETTTLNQSLNINYTEFFRSTLTFAYLEQWILPALIESKANNSEIRIWSAGCSSGQEAYSLAILIENIASKKSKKIRYRIIATDISESVLVKANNGEYSERDIQNIRAKDLNEFFSKSGNVYKVSDRLKQNVDFSKHDLLDNLSSFPKESIFGAFDLVVCSNLLFYYKPVYQQRILNKLIDSIVEDGYLITGEVEKQAVVKHKNLRLVVPPLPIFKKDED